MALLGLGVAFLASQGVIATSITPVAGAGGVAGAPYDVVPVASSVSVPTGPANLVAGKELAYVELAVPSQSNTVGVDVNWLDPQDAAAVLTNPNAVLVVGLYYPVASAADCTTPADPFTGQNAYTVTQPATQVVCLAPGSNSWAALEAPSRHHQGHTTEAVLSGLPSSLSTFYVVASIVTPGHAPQGQQSQITSLDFRLSVKGG